MIFDKIHCSAHMLSSSTLLNERRKQRDNSVYYSFSESSPFLKFIFSFTFFLFVELVVLDMLLVFHMFEIDCLKKNNKTIIVIFFIFIFSFSIIRKVFFGKMFDKKNVINSFDFVCKEKKKAI